MSRCCQMQCGVMALVLPAVLLVTVAGWGPQAISIFPRWVPGCLTALPAVPTRAFLIPPPPQLQTPAIPCIHHLFHTPLPGPLCDEKWQVYGLKPPHWGYRL